MQTNGFLTLIYEDRFGIIYSISSGTLQNRGRGTNEIVPASAEHSKTVNDNENSYNANNAIDTVWASCSYTAVGTDSKAWWKANLGQVHCVYQMFEFQNNGNHRQTFTCSENGFTCSFGPCTGAIVATVEGGISADLATFSDCKYGNTVKFESTGTFFFYELAIIKKPGLNRSLNTFSLFFRKLGVSTEW